MHRFGLKAGIHFDFLVSNRVWFTKELRLCSSFQFQMNKKESAICEFEIDFKKSFCCGSNLSNDKEGGKEVGARKVKLKW